MEGACEGSGWEGAVMRLWPPDRMIVKHAGTGKYGSSGSKLCARVDPVDGLRS